MPNLLKQIPQTMRKQGIPEETITRFDFPETGGAEEVMALINQMDKLLSKEQCISVMQEQGCCKTGKPAAAHRAFGQANSGKPLIESVAKLNETEMIHKAPCRLNDDGTLSVWWGSENYEKEKLPLRIYQKTARIHRSAAYVSVAAAVVTYGAIIRNRSV